MTPVGSYSSQYRKTESGQIGDLRKLAAALLWQAWGYIMRSTMTERALFTTHQPALQSIDGKNIQCRREADRQSAASLVIASFISSKPPSPC
jgi:hypothetical protein